MGAHYEFSEPAWGISKQNLKALEKASLIDEGNNSISYESNLLGHDIRIIYNFVDNKMCGIIYRCGGIFEQVPKCDSASIYSEFNAMITELHGMPVVVDQESSCQFTLPTEKNVEGKVSKWDTDKTYISSLLCKSKETVAFEASFTSKELKDAHDESLKSSLDQLVSNIHKLASEYKLTYHLEVLNWRCYKERGWLIAMGEVRNNSNKTLTSLKAVVTWYDDDDEMVIYDSSLIEYPNLNAGETSPFKIMCKYTPDAKKAKLEFMNLLTGAKIPSFISSNSK